MSGVGAGWECGDRPFWQHRGLLYRYTINDDAHECLLALDPKYTSRVRFECFYDNPTIASGFYLYIPDRDMALLFKLTWGGK